jgi:hypothetical protein
MSTFRYNQGTSKLFMFIAPNEAEDTEHGAKRKEN